MTNEQQSNALHFKVTAREAFDWLYTVDFDGLSDALIDEVSNDN